jgi:tetratricopeptide (TPR) repeat protein
MDPLRFEFRLADFDLGLLPIGADLLKANPSLLRESIEAYLGDYFRPIGGTASIAARGDMVSVDWSPTSASDLGQLKALALRLLRDGAVAQAQPILDALRRHDPADGDLLLEYGMMLSDAGRPEDAAQLLKGITEREPERADAWNALGVAYWRLNRIEEATAALERAHTLAPDDAHVLKNYGSLVAKRSPAEARPLLAKAAELLPGDQTALYNYGLCLQRLDQYDAAFAVFQRAVDAAPYSNLAEQVRTVLSEMSVARLKKESPQGLRMDAVLYCLAALRKFATVTEQQRHAITSEIALLGRNGLDIASPDKKYTLRTMPGRFSGLELLSWMYVGLKAIAPDRDPQIELHAEYAAAVGIFDKKDKDQP